MNKRTAIILIAITVLARQDQPRAGVGEGRERPVRTTVDGVPVYSFGHTYILGQCPDFTTGLKLQKDNDNAITKIRLKKSWEIKKGWTGGSNPHMPRSEMMDRFQAPYLPINLIDGDPETYWCSRGQPVPNMEPAWIRLDLARETWVKSIVLRRRTRPFRVSWQIGSPPGVHAAGDGVPRDLTIKVAQDALNWITVAEKKDYAPSEDDKRLVFDVDPPRPVKQVWIIGNELPPVDCWGCCFSLADVEVLDAAGNNVASALHGAGVTVSSTEDTYPDNRETTEDLWATAWDLGIKWVRVAAWTSPLMWSYVEREEKGKYHLDPVTDQAVTDLAENGVNVLLGLSYGNYLYDKPRQWQKEQTDILELPMPPLEGEARQAFLRWTRFMVNHFKDRVQYYYIWNEPYQSPPYGWGDSKKFADFVKDVTRVIRDEYPEAKISWPTALTYGEFLEGCLAEGVAPLFDMIHADLSPRGLKAKQLWRDAGFKGDHFITYEWSSLATYPTPTEAVPYTNPGAVVSEIEKAKRVARSATHQAGHRIIMSICEWFNTYHPIWDVGIFRNTFSADPVSPTQPQPAYYVLRNMSTILAECEPAKFEYQVLGTDKPAQVVQFEREGGNRLMALWFESGAPRKYSDLTTETGFVLSIAHQTAATVDQPEDVVIDLRLPNQGASRVVAIDALNGVEQDLGFDRSDGDLLITGLLAKDYPLYVEIEP